MKNSKEIKLALTVICAVVVIYFGINFLKGINIFKSYSTYYINFNDVSGLEESNPVYANGYPVGIVRSINYDYEHPQNIRVKIEVDRKMRFTDNSRAEIKQGLIGGTTLSVIIGDGITLKPGDSFSGGPENGIMAKAGNMMPSIEKMVPKVDSILASLNTLLGDTALSNIIANTEYVTHNLCITTDQLNRLMKNEIPTLMAQLNAIVHNTGDITSKLNTIDYAATIKNVNDALHNVRQLTESISEKINSKSGSLGLLLNDTQLYDNLNQTLVSSDKLLQDLKEHPKRYVHFSVFGKKDK